MCCFCFRFTIWFLLLVFDFYFHKMHCHDPCSKIIEWPEKLFAVFILIWFCKYKNRFDFFLPFAAGFVETLLWPSISCCAVLDLIFVFIFQFSFYVAYGSRTMYMENSVLLDFPFFLLACTYFMLYSFWLFKSITFNKFLQHSTTKWKVLNWLKKLKEMS